MARNINKCTKRRYGRLHCALMLMTEDPEGKYPEEDRCAMCLHDEYRMYPETDSSGDVIHNRHNATDPFPHGVDVIWENDTINENGLTFSFRRIRAEEYNMHPRYTIQDINEPSMETVDDENGGYAFGGDNVSLSPIGWADQIVLGMEKVTDCNMGIYGKYDKIEKIVLPKCLRDYTGDIKGWINYTSLPSNPRKKTFFACDESDDAIIDHCVRWFGKTATAAAIYQILVAIKNGEYINLREALVNHNLPDSTVQGFMKVTSTKSKRTIYSSMNLYKYYYYWKALPRLKLPKEKVYLFRCHMLNYILNYPPIRRMNPKKPPIQISGNKLFYSTNHRYWWVYLMVQDALEIGKRTGKPLLTNPEIGWFRKLMDALEEENNSLIKEPTDLKNPAVETFAELVKLKHTSPGIERKKRVFARILKAGKKWTPTEVRITWHFFLKAYDAKKPERFWEFIEIIQTGSAKTIESQIRQAGIQDDSGYSSQRAFSHNLLESRKSRNSFDVREPLLYPRWQQVSPKAGFGFSDEDKPKREHKDIFWDELKRVWFKGPNKKENILQILHAHLCTLPRRKAEELARLYQEEMNEDIIIGTDISKDDIGREGKIVIRDIDGNIDTFGGDESWHSSESAE